MNFFLVMGTLCILLVVNVETKLSECTLFHKDGIRKNYTFPYGYVCTKSSCDWTVDSNCKSGTSSKVLKWETDIFEIGFEGIDHIRPREIVVNIDLNKDYYIEIKVITDNEKRTVKIILNECSHSGKTCLENQNFTFDNLNFEVDQVFLAIGFRKDKKMNFAAVSKEYNRASNDFGPKNEFKFKMKGFYFDTKDTMKITVSSSLDENFKNDGFRMILPTSVGGFVFNVHGYLVHGNDYGCKFYFNTNEGESLPYIMKEYYKNSENWRANPVKYTVEWGLPYFDENGMKFTTEQMKIKEVKNPYFDAEKMIRKGCKLVDKETGEESPGLTPTGEPNLFPEGESQTLEEIRIADEIFRKKTNAAEGNINITEFIERVGGNKSLHQDYLSNVGKGRNDYIVTLENGTIINMNEYMFANPNPKKKDTKEGGSGGDGDASRGQKQVKIISPKYIIVFLILMILSV